MVYLAVETRDARSERNNCNSVGVRNGKMNTAESYLRRILRAKGAVPPLKALMGVECSIGGRSIPMVFTGSPVSHLTHLLSIGLCVWAIPSVYFGLGPDFLVLYLRAFVVSYLLVWLIVLLVECCVGPRPTTARAAVGNGSLTSL